VRRRQRLAGRRLQDLLGLTLAGQIALHLVFGTETFLYALNWAPLLVIWAAMGAATIRRPMPVRVLAIAAALCSLVNNERQFRWTASFVSARNANAQEPLPGGGRVSVFSRGPDRIPVVHLIDAVGGGYEGSGAGGVERDGN